MDYKYPMDPYYFEEKSCELISNFNGKFNSKSYFFSIILFYRELFKQHNAFLTEAYIHETLPDFLIALNKYSCYGLPPEKSNEVLKTILALGAIVDDENHKSELLIQYNRIKNEVKLLHKILHISQRTSVKSVLNFPVLEMNFTDKNRFGAIEYFIVSINKNKKTDKTEFIIMPSFPILDPVMENQIETSWNYAINYLQRKSLLSTSQYEVAIRFGNNFGFYEGNSFGAALTVYFIQELYSFLGIEAKYRFEKNILMTGSMDKNGNINSIGEESAKSKLLIAFYSNTDIFIIPQNDFNYIAELFAKLNSTYPNRNLTIIPIANITELLTEYRILSI